MKNRTSTLLRGLAVFAASIVVGQVASRATVTALQRGGPAIGTTIPENGLLTLEGAPVAGHSPHGRVEVLNFWATWCPGCRREMPALAEFARAHAHDCLSLVGISTEEPATLRSFAAERPPGYPFSSSSGDLERQLGVQALPTTIVVDGTGHVVARHVGALSLEELEALVRPVLEGSRC